MAFAYFQPFLGSLIPIPSNFQAKRAWPPPFSQVSYLQFLLYDPCSSLSSHCKNQPNIHITAGGHKAEEEQESRATGILLHLPALPSKETSKDSAHFACLLFSRSWTNGADIWTKIGLIIHWRLRFFISLETGSNNSRIIITFGLYPNKAQSLQTIVRSSSQLRLRSGSIQGQKHYWNANWSSEKMHCQKEELGNMGKAYFLMRDDQSFSSFKYMSNLSYV